jgi:MFS family permease
MSTFLTLWASQSASLIGTMVSLFALNIWQATVLYPRADQKPQLAASLALTTLAFAIPTVFAAPLAGAWADRHDRRRLMIAANLVSAAVSAVLIAMLATGRVGVAGAALLLAVYALAGAFHSAAFDASYVMLVPSDRLPRANAMMMTSQALSGLVAPGFAAALITLPRLLSHGTGAVARLASRLPNGVPLAIGFDLVTFLAAALVLASLRVPSPAPGPGRSLARDLALGWGFLGRQPALLWLLSMFALANFSYAFYVILSPLLVRFTYMAHHTAMGLPFEPAYALLSTVGSLGGVAGGVVLAAWGGLRRRRVLGVVGGMMLIAVFLTGFGLAKTLLLACVFSALFQSTIPALNAHSATLWQTRTPPELQGRVFSARRMVAQGTLPLGTALAGFLATRLDPGVMLITLGATLAVFSAAMLANRPLMTIEDTAPPA